MALTALGVTSFVQNGNSEWRPNGWNLDQLIVPMDGVYSGLSAYQASLTMWSAATEDANMFLSGWTVDTHKQYPTVHLNYLGKRGGILPPSKSFQGYSIQQARFTSFSGKSYINLTYIGPSSSKIIWSRTAISIASIGPATPPNVVGVEYSSRFDTSEQGPSNLTGALTFFTQAIAQTGNSEEMVPGQYFRGEAISTNLMFSNEA